MHCRICGKKSEENRQCKNCDYLLKHGADEETIRRMQSDDATKKIWKENEKLAEDLANAYYDSVLENYNRSQIKKDSKENFGYNTFIEGIRAGLDIVIPLLDLEMQKKVKEEIHHMTTIRQIQNEKRNT